MQGQGHGGTQYTGVFDVVKHLYKEGGLRSVFRGSAATVARDGPGSAAYFAAYELTKRALTPAGADPGELNLGAIIMAGGTAGIAMWSIAIPPDVGHSIPEHSLNTDLWVFRSSSRGSSLRQLGRILASWTVHAKLLRPTV